MFSKRMWSRWSGFQFWAYSSFLLNVFCAFIKPLTESQIKVNAFPSASPPISLFQTLSMLQHYNRGISGIAHRFICTSCIMHVGGRNIACCADAATRINIWPFVSLCCLETCSHITRITQRIVTGGERACASIIGKHLPLSVSLASCKSNTSRLRGSRRSSVKLWGFERQCLCTPEVNE